MKRIFKRSLEYRPIGRKLLETFRISKKEREKSEVSYEREISSVAFKISSKGCE